MKAFILLILCVFLSFTVTAQRIKITLAGQSTTKPLPNIEIKDVIDLRNDKTNIGWVQKGMGNSKIHADLVAGLKEELKWFLKTNAASSGKKIPVIIKVNQFAISEKTLGDWKYANAEVALEFLTQELGQTDYCLLLQTGSSVQTSSMTEVPGGHANNLARVLEDCFTQASELIFTDFCSSAVLVPPSFLEINSYNKVDPQTIPILSTSAPQNGVYLNFTDFKNNAPGYVDAEVTMNRSYNYFETYSGKKIKEFWGYSDGNQTFIRYGDAQNFFPLTKYKDHFTFVANVTTTNTGAIIIGSIIGGVAGGFIAGILTENTRAVEFSVNPITGIVKPVQDFGSDTVVNKTSKLVIYRNAKNEKSEPLKIFINDSLAAQIPTNSFSEFSFNIPVSEKSICVQASESNCQKIIPISDKILYYECSLPVKGTVKPILKPVTTQEAEYYLKIIKHHQRKNTN